MSKTTLVSVSLTSSFGHMTYKNTRVRLCLKYVSLYFNWTYFLYFFCDISFLQKSPCKNTCTRSIKLYIVSYTLRYSTLQEYWIFTTNDTLRRGKKSSSLHHPTTFGTKWSNRASRVTTDLTAEANNCESAGKTMIRVTIAFSQEIVASCTFTRRFEVGRDFSYESPHKWRTKQILHRQIEEQNTEIKREHQIDLYISTNRKPAVCIR